MIKELVERKRGCGFRKKGGLYLIGTATFSACGMLPIPLHICPTCNQGIKPARGFVWISPDIWKGRTCKEPKCIQGPSCYPFNGMQPMITSSGEAAKPLEKVGLMWVGGGYYPTPGAFLRESQLQGVSKRIPFLPKGFVVGETWVLLAHKKPEPAIFAAFLPQEVQYVVKDDDTEESIAAKEKRGITCVRVYQHGEQLAIPDAEKGGTL